ncbi:MAG: SDR family oxidoreductase, partial [Proteobacteria bacterium]|jgi:NAD(P)-dependent dehydrogenase (short-subunit alcohol dehydrogenase family)|nr:SDR family oxidoreductase [Pseudomonadota bacterium]NBT95517.1 SDR family oxidoreductase [Chloroflexota bacterium]NBU89285.1 SDR family oxidoreductase [Betaproteobacteria bacterium]NBX46984.1 SDR family oxidoreductase [Chloroflexota bacterium]NBY46371.1 SDR family oxidoreductase [Pseudomonadota bacterium]
MSAGTLAGKVAIVTGAGTGIGRASAIALAHAGAKVALSGRRPGILEDVAKTIHDHGGEAIVVPGDVSNPADVDHLFDSVAAKWGRLDILFTNAGTNTKHRNIHDITLEDWQHVVAVNLSGAFYCARRALPVMRAQREGTIINLVSMAAKRAGALPGVAYSASKAGQASLTQSINDEEKAYNIRACSIFPGEVDTDIMDARPVVPSRESRDLMLKSEDVAAAVLLVASLPQRALIEEIMIRPTHVRDQSKEVRRAD